MMYICSTVQHSGSLPGTVNLYLKSSFNCVRLEVLVGTSMKLAAFWDVASTDNHSDGDSKLLQNVSQHLPEYMTQHSRRQAVLWFNCV
jgi:hypothetical protein